MRYIITILILTILLALPASSRLPEHGKQWLRNNEPVIFSWADMRALDFAQYKAAKMTGFMHDTNTPERVELMNSARSVHQLIRMPYVYGSYSDVVNWISGVTTPDDRTIWCAADEPDTEALPAVGDVIKYLKKNRPDGPTFVNALAPYIPDGPTYLSNVMSICDPDILMFDYYPFNGTAEGETIDNFFKALTNVRGAAAASNVPLFSWIQTFAGYGGSWRSPSESEMRMLIWSSLTAGASGIGCFFFGGPTIDSNMYNALIWNGSPTQLHDSFVGSFPGLANHLKWMRHLTNRSYKFVPGSGHSTPEGITNWTYQPEYNTHVTGFTANTAAPKADGLVGLFTDDVGNQYFMLTNLRRGSSLTTSQAAASFTIQFNSGVTTVYRLDRDTGLPVTHTLDANNRLTITIPGGAGELFCCSNAFTLPIFRGSVKINGDTSDYTNVRDVTLNVSGQLESSPSTNAGQMRFKIDQNTTAWEAYAETKAITLPEGDGKKTVRVQFKDAQGRETSWWSDDIILDTTPPTGSISINNGASFVNTPSVTLNVTATDSNGLSEMRFSSNNTDWSEWYTYATTRSWTLTTGSGEKTVYAEFRDNAGNVSESCNVIITMDTGPPGVSGVPSHAGRYTNNPVIFNWTPADDPVSGIQGYHFQVGTNPGWSNLFNQFVGNVLSQSVTGVNGSTYYARVVAKDNAGNWGTWSASSGPVTVDLVAPIPGQASSPASASGNTIQVSYSGASDALSGIEKVELCYKKESGGIWTNSGLSCTQSAGAFDFAPSSGSGIYYFGTVAEDIAGNISDVPTGNGACSTNYTSPRSVSGRVTLQNFSFSTQFLVQVTVELRKQGESPTTTTINVGSDGSYTLEGTGLGTYDIAFKAGHWLRSTIYGVQIDGQVTGKNVSLVNGDCDGDNEITARDYNIILAAFGASSGQANWNSMADLNGDGAITAADADIVIANFARLGD